MAKTPARHALAHNLRRLMAETPALNTQEKVAAKAKVAQTSVSQILRPDNLAARSPKLDQVEKIAHAFGISAWQLLVEPPASGDQLKTPPGLTREKRPATSRATAQKSR